MKDSNLRDFRVTYAERAGYAYAEHAEHADTVLVGTERVVCDGLTLNEAHAIARMINQSKGSGYGTDS